MTNERLDFFTYFRYSKSRIEGLFVACQHFHTWKSARTLNPMWRQQPVSSGWHAQFSACRICQSGHGWRVF